MDYKKAGVDIEAGYKSVELMKKHVKETMRPEVLRKIKELLLAGNYHCSIVNFAGHEMFKKDFKKRIVNISPTGKRQKYLITYENSTNLSEIY